jgi:hypothetical protein
MKPNDVYLRCGHLLHDVGNVRWSKDELRIWISDAQRAICTLRPDAHVESVEVTLQPGAIHELPDSVVKLIDITHNVTVSAAEHIAARAVTVTDREELDRFDVAWRSGRKNKVVQQFMHDATKPRVFYTYPPNDGTGLVSADVATMPPELANADDDVALPLGDEFAEAIVNFVMTKAYSKDGEFVSRAGDYMNLFVAAMSGEHTATKAYQPNVTKTGGKPDFLAQQTGGV